MYNKFSVVVSSVTSYIILSYLIIGLTCTPVLAEPIFFAGSDTVGNVLLPKLLEAYNRQAASKIEYLRINPQGTKNGWCAYEQQTTEHIDVIMASSIVTVDDLLPCNGQLKADELHTPEIEHLIALDGVVIIVHKDNPVPILAMDEIKEIFCSDKPLSWKNFNWVDEPIEVVALDEGSGTTATIRQVVCEGKHLPAAATSSFTHHDQIVDYLKAPGHNYAIGFTSLGALNNSNDIKNIKIKDCGRVYEPDRYTVKTEDYPLSRRLLLYTPKPEINAKLKPFFDFVLGEKGQNIVNDTKYLDLSVEEVDSKSSSDLARNKIIQEGSYIAENEIKTFREFTNNAKRLSIVFRFKKKSAILDIRGETDILRIKEYIKKRKRGDVLLLLGFADSEGGYYASLNKASERAEVVQDKLKEIAEKQGVIIETKSIGPELPVACNQREIDRERNRRVEVWLKH